MFKFPDIVVFALSVTAPAVLLIVKLAGWFAVNPVPVTWAAVPLYS